MPVALVVLYKAYNHGLLRQLYYIKLLGLMFFIKHSIIYCCVWCTIKHIINDCCVSYTKKHIIIDCFENILHNYAMTLGFRGWGYFCNQILFNSKSKFCRVFT